MNIPNLSLKSYWYVADGSWMIWKCVPWQLKLSLIMTICQDYTREKKVSLYMGKSEILPDPMEAILDTATTPTFIFRQLPDGW